MPRPSLLPILVLCGLNLEGPRGRAEPARSRAAAVFAAAIEEAHGLAAWKARPAVEAEVVVEFGGKRVVDGTMTFRTDAGASRLVLKDGTVAVFDGKEAWISPAGATFKDVRFHVLTWPYFASVPMKLRDPGTRLEALGERKLFGRPHAAVRLTFDQGVGDTPDDWYVLYQEPKTRRLAGMGYIVTYGTPKAAAEKEPHAITYDQFMEIEGATISTRWTFWNWKPEEGATGQPLGKARLQNVRFVVPAGDLFTAPAGARREDQPRP